VGKRFCEDIIKCDMTTTIWDKENLFGWKASGFIDLGLEGLKVAR
jgi:hypothetical protein